MCAGVGTRWQMVSSTSGQRRRRGLPWTRSLRGSRSSSPSVFKMMNSVFKMMNSVFKMMDMYHQGMNFMMEVAKLRAARQVSSNEFCI